MGKKLKTIIQQPQRKQKIKEVEGPMNIKSMVLNNFLSVVRQLLGLTISVTVQSFHPAPPSKCQND